MSFWGDSGSEDGKPMRTVFTVRTSFRRIISIWRFTNTFEMSSKRMSSFTSGGIRATSGFLENKSRLRALIFPTS